MIKIFRVISFLFFLSYSHAKDYLIFSPLPMEDIKTEYSQFYPMIKFLENKLHKKIKFDYSKNYEEVLEKFTQNKIDLAYLGPLPYITLKNSYSQALPLIHFNNKNNKNFYTCSLITFMGNEEYKSNIVNKKIALTQPLSTCGYLGVNALLKENNSSIENNKYRYLGRHDEVALSIVRGKFDLGGVKSSIAKKYYNLGIKELSKTLPLPTFSLVGNTSTLSQDITKKIKNILTRVHKSEYKSWGEKINNGCSEAKDENFDNLRKLIGNTNIPQKGNF